MAEATDRPVALITGSSRGIGRACALRLARDGHRVVLSARQDGPELQDAAAAVAELAGAPPLCLPMDVADATQVEAAIKQLFATHRRLDVLVANAGVMDQAPLGLMPADRVERLLSVNTAGALHCLQLGSRLMARRPQGSVVLVSSIVGLQGAAGAVAYAAAKSALVGMTRAAAQELGPRGIRVNAVAPGLVDTAMVADLPVTQRDALIARTALGRIATPDDVAAVVGFLAGPDSAFVTGQVIGVDGGLRL
ncbi:MAG: SDR family oxidoreductase [Alphaproteobacteria bacterium]|nr:SDR family oxidoreductase [Alphaproteobacteria bacterium]